MREVFEEFIWMLGWTGMRNSLIGIEKFSILWIGDKGIGFGFGFVHDWIAYEELFERNSVLF